MAVICEKGFEGVNWIRLTQIESSSESFCEQGNEPARLLKGEEFLDETDDLKFLKKSKCCFCALHRNTLFTRR